MRLRLEELQALTANGIGVVILIGLLLSLRGKYDKKKDEYFIFTVMLLVNMAQCILETISVFIDAKLFYGAVTLSKCLNTMLFVNNVVFAMLWVLYADLRLRKFGSKSTRKYLFTFLPGLLTILMVVVNLFTPIFFGVDENNVYYRGKWFILTYVVTYFYLVWGMVAAYFVRQKEDKYVFLPAITFLIPISIASILQFVFQGISLLWVGGSIGLMSAYMSLQDERAAIDPLSGVFTRHYMNQYLDMQCKKSGDNRISGIMLDIDKFKSINDQYGHLIGDEVIRKFGGLLRRAVNGRGIVFRYAGDEFVVVVVNRSKEEMLKLISDIHGGMEKVNAEDNVYKIACSLGYATYVPGEKTSHFLKRMDDAMYTNKNNKKRKEEGNVVIEDEELVEAGIDVPDLLNRLMQNKSLIRVFAKKFIENKSYEHLREVAEKADAKQMEFDAHILKGMCGNLSLKALYSLFTEQVRLLRVGEKEQAIHMMPIIDEEYKRTVEHMKKWLDGQTDEVK